MFVKICGLTNRDDAMAAVDAGAKALGFIFARSSPRYVTVEQLAPWMEDVPVDVWRVGVFVDEARERMEEIAAQLHLDIAQLHGTETPDAHPKNVRVWKAFRVSDKGEFNDDYPADALLLDGPRNGVTFNWRAAQRAQRPVVLAGGLTEDNVSAGDCRSEAMGVDTSSGVEIAPGRKDREKMKRFIERAMAA